MRAMASSFGRLAAVALLLAAGHLFPANALAGGGGGVRVDPNFPPLSGPPAKGGGFRDRDVPRGYGGRALRPQIYCDGYGRCFQRFPDRFSGGSYRTRPPGWADDLPGRVRYPDRFSRPRSEVVCDQATNVCYRRGRVDRSETRDVFGDRAADRADDLRDRRGTARLFVPERGVSCDTGRRVCFDGGVPDVSLTRRYFGGGAAAGLD